MVSLDFHSDMILFLRIILALLLGCFIGWERERHGISAGIRTFGAISLGACVFGILSFIVLGSDPSRIASQVATGIGFLGGGVIFRQDENYVSGLTTAAMLWAMAAIGLAVAFGMYAVSILTTILAFLLLYLPRLRWWKKISKKVNRIPQKDEF